MKPHPLPVKLLAASVLGLAVSARAQQTMMDYDPYSNEIVRKENVVSDWTQHVSAGAFVGFNVSAKFNENGVFNVGNNAAKGIYDDGYVRTDDTGNAGGYTGYWGYNNSSQFNSTKQTLSFDSATSFTGAGSSEDRGVFPGGEISYGGDNFWNWKRLHVGWDAGLGIVPISLKGNSSISDANVNQTVYTYNTGGIFMPSAPYQGGPSGSGEPIISTAFTTSSTNGVGQISGSHSLDVLFFALRLGPTLRVDLTRHFALDVGAGPALGIVTGYYRYNETITYTAADTGQSISANNSGRFETTAITYGGYINAMLSYRIQDVTGPADVFLGAQYMPMTEAKFSQGGREADLNLKGQIYLTAGLSWPF